MLKFTKWPPGKKRIDFSLLFVVVCSIRIKVHLLPRSSFPPRRTRKTNLALSAVDWIMTGFMQVSWCYQKTTNAKIRQQPPHSQVRWFVTRNDLWFNTADENSVNRRRDGEVLNPMFLLEESSLRGQHISCSIHPLAMSTWRLPEPEVMRQKFRISNTDSRFLETVGSWLDQCRAAWQASVFSLWINDMNGKHSLLNEKKPSTLY